MEKSLDEKIFRKYMRRPQIYQSSVSKHDSVAQAPAPVGELSYYLFENHQIQKSSQPENISAALLEVKEQMLVSDHFRPEYFLWGLELIEDEEKFGMINTYQKNKLTKFVLNLNFRKASEELADYFKERLPISRAEIGHLSRRKN